MRLLRQHHIVNLVAAVDAFLPRNASIIDKIFISSYSYHHETACTNPWRYKSPCISSSHRSNLPAVYNLAWRLSSTAWEYVCGQ